MKTVAYCRVSTNKDEQLDSLEAQQHFFSEYAKKNNDYNLINIYADEGISGTKMKNRPALLKMLRDAEDGKFEVVLIKDVSRLARNTVDFLTSIRRLKALNVKVVFVNYEHFNSDSAELLLTMMSAMAQEESASMSKRVKFGKRVNKERGRVPNDCYGYDKTPGEYFTLDINEHEASIVREVYEMYTTQNYGMNKIAMIMNERGEKGKRDGQFSQASVKRILINPIYTGKIVHGREEIKDFLTGEREKKSEDEWIITVNEDLRLISDETFEKAQKIIQKRHKEFNLTGERSSQKHVFSKLITCECCGYSFRRFERTYVNTYVRWICSRRNANGIGVCSNKTTIDEAELLEIIRDYFTGIMNNKERLVEQMSAQIEKKYKNKSESFIDEKELSKRLKKVIKAKEKQMAMFENDIIDINELKSRTSDLNSEIEELQKKIDIAKFNIDKDKLLEDNVKDKLKDIKRALDSGNFTNEVLSSIIERISVSEQGDVKIYLRVLE